MASRIFLDANVLLDLALERDSYSPAVVLFQRIKEGQIKAHISPSIVHIIGHWLSKFRSRQQAKQVLLTFLNDIQVLEMDHEMSVLALGSSFNDIEDALQYYVALHHKMEIFISRDRNLKKSALPSLPVVTVEEFLKTF